MLDPYIGGYAGYGLMLEHWTSFWCQFLIEISIIWRFALLITAKEPRKAVQRTEDTSPATTKHPTNITEDKCALFLFWETKTCQFLIRRMSIFIPRFLNWQIDGAPSMLSILIVKSCERAAQDGAFIRSWTSRRPVKTVPATNCVNFY